MTRPFRRDRIRAQYRTWRIAAGLSSQLATAEATGISASRIWRLENAYAEPTAAEQQSLARAFGLTLEQFVDTLADIDGAAA
jgi:transcriptional regulator with XRE-family HTH domain